MAVENGQPSASNQVGIVVEQDVAVVAVAEPFPMKRLFVESLTVITMGKSFDFKSGKFMAFLTLLCFSCGT
jgi:hypothetical protein